MKTAILLKIHASYKSGERKSSVDRMLRKLYGYDDPSNYSKYHYHREGLLERIPSVRYEKGLVMIREEDLDTVVSFIKKYNADYMKWKVIPEEEEMKQLGLHVA